MKDQRKIVWPGDFRPGNRVIIEKYPPTTEAEPQKAVVLGIPPGIILDGIFPKPERSIVPVGYRDSAGQVVVKWVLADNLTLIGQTRGKEANS